jgi:F-type H+-transporting ATPase subunit b
MLRFSRFASLASLSLVLVLSAPALADQRGHDAPHAEAPAAGAHVDPHGDHGHGDHGHGDHGAVKAEGHAEHGSGHDHAPTFDDINWAYGFLGEKEGEEPSLLWRPKGMPVPFGALALNAAILYFLLFKFGRKPIGDALKARKLGIMKGMEDAAKMKAEAEASLAKYQKKLDEIDSEVARIKSEAKEQSEAERVRILSEAKERRTRMERDARTLVEQELKAARETLTRDTVRAAVKSAEATLTAKVGDADQQRLGDEFLASIKASGAVLRGRL